jgi:RND family efflux transporter MFP subunit
MVAVAAASIAGCGQGNTYVPPPPPDVEVGVPVLRNVTEYAEFTGTTAASAMIEVRAQVQGYLQSIHFTDGTDVNKGDLLFVIDPRPFQAKLEQAKANLESATAMAVRAEAIYKRAVSLLPSKAVSQEEVDTTRGDWGVAKASVLQAQAQVREAQLNVEYTSIRAPLSGRISRRLVDIGNLVQANSILLTTLAHYDPMYAYFTVSEVQLLEYLNQLQRDQATSSRPLRYPVEMGLANEVGYPHKGTIDFADNTVDPGTGTITVRGTFPNPQPYLLRPGLFVRVRAPTGTRPAALLVPERALGQDQAGQYVLVVLPDNVVQHRQVKTGVSVEDYRVILDGLKAGERFVVEGLQRARPGTKVNPIPARGS